MSNDGTTAGGASGGPAANAAASADPAQGLRGVGALRRLTERLEELQVDNARSHGWSWQEIADHLEVSRQAVHKKHARRRRAEN